MGYIVLPAGTVEVLFEDVPGLIARALYPPERGESLGAGVLRVDAEGLHRKALRIAADAREFPLFNHAGLQETPSPRGRMRVQALREYAAKFEIAVTVAQGGAGVRQSNVGQPKPQPWPAADWELWASMPKATLREAVLLSVGLDPRPTRTMQAGHAPPELSKPGPEFDRRLTLACAHLSEHGPLRPLSLMQLLGTPGEVEVSLPAFRAWAEGLGWKMPERFPAATVTATATAPAPAAAEVPSEAHAGRRWGPEELDMLRDYRATYGTKAAAEHFGVSASRVRALLPGDKPPPKGHSVFHLHRK